MRSHKCVKPWLAKNINRWPEPISLISPCVLTLRHAPCKAILCWNEQNGLEICINQNMANHSACESGSHRWNPHAATPPLAQTQAVNLETNAKNIECSHCSWDSNQAVNVKIQIENPMCSHHSWVWNPDVNLKIHVENPMCSQHSWVKNQDVHLEIHVENPMRSQHSWIWSQDVNLEIQIEPPCAHNTPGSGAKT